MWSGTTSFATTRRFVHVFDALVDEHHLAAGSCETATGVVEPWALGVTFWSMGVLPGGGRVVDRLDLRLR